MTITSRVLLAVFLIAAACPVAAGTPASPEAFFGFQPGADGELFDYSQLIAYLKAADAASDRVELREVGRSPLDRSMYVLFISAADNIHRLDELREINRRLALDPEIPEPERNGLVTDGRVFVMATLSMHSSEVGPSQSLPLFVHQLAITDDEAVLEQLDDMVWMIVPCHNPDGMDMVVENYRKWAGTNYDGASLPGIYHRYVGHDNNRDFITLSQTDTQVISDLYSTVWFPQVMTEKHQMGKTGPRYFVPSYHDPIAENIDAGLWTWSALFGSAMAKDMERQGLEGVAQHWLFDNYWPGSTETCLWKNVISFLTEAASCRVASPVFIEPTELRVRGKGLSEYKKSSNMPLPWPGGWWRLSDIVTYELASLRSVMKTASLRHEEILRFRNDLCRREVARGKTEAPFYFVLPATQHDRSAYTNLVELLQRHGVTIFELSERLELDSTVFAAGDLVVPLAQPYRAFVKEVLEAQKFPVRHYTPDGEVIKPYDITSWSLPLHRGVHSVQVDKRSPELEKKLKPLADGWVEARRAVKWPQQLWGVAFTATDNAAFHAAFAALGEGLEVSRLTVAAEIAGSSLPPGSFVIKGRSDALRNLAETVNLQPLALTAPPEVETISLELPTIGLMETWFHDMDAGWTRFVFDSYDIPYTVLRPADLESTDLGEAYDVLVFPDAGKHVLLKGKRKWGDDYHSANYPPEFTKTVSAKGLAALVDFLDDGGIVVSWRQSAALFLDSLKTRGEKEGEGQQVELPAADVSEALKKKGLYVPGAFLKVLLLEDHPLTWGMPVETGVFSRGAPVFRTSVPDFDTDRRVIALHPEEDVLLSGYVEGEKYLANQPVMLWLRRGAGQLVLMGFYPQFRASTPATTKLLFNALLLQKTKP